MPVETVELTGKALVGIAPQMDEIAKIADTISTLPVKLGRRRPKARPQCLRFGAYFDAVKAAPPPTIVDYAAKAMASIEKVYLNDTYGDCVIAGKYHAEGVWSANDLGSAVLGTDQEVYSAYETICGPGDNGCLITAVLDYFRDKGLTFSGAIKKIDGYVSVDWTNRLEVQVALYLFGAITIGINLPQAWTSNAVWDVTSTPIVGGHDVTCVGYDDQGVQVASWGRIYTITWTAFLSSTWLEEAYVMLAPDWYGNDRLAPSGVDADTLRNDLAKLGGGTIPPITPTPVPPPGPAPAPPAPTNPPPNYAGSIQGTMIGPLGNHSFSGTVALQPVATATIETVSYQLLEQLRGSPNWIAVITDIVALVAAIRSKNVQAIVAAIEKLATDLGIALPPLRIR
jgi:hypothetical protein